MSFTINIIFSRGSGDIEDAGYVFSPDVYFKFNYEEEWFEDELVKEMVQDVDRSEVICDRDCAVLSGDGKTAILRLRRLMDTVVFVDEQERFLSSTPGEECSVENIVKVDQNL